ncbi:MAG: M56 family metallopeptidase [Planctomycetota bacterium]
MSSPGFPELFISLTLQCSLVLLMAWMLTRRAASSAAADRIWAQAHVLILVLCLMGGFLPHLRILQPDFVLILLGQIASSGWFRVFFQTIGYVWVAGVLLLSLITLASIIRTHRLVRRCCDKAHLAELESISATEVHSIKATPETCKHLQSLRVTIVWSSEAVTPFCWQLHTPVIVLPEAIQTFPDAELDAVLRHELAHLNAKHPLRLFLQRLLEIGFWFHPLVWLSSREASLQRELASDLMANLNVVQAKTFLRGMVRLAEQRSHRTPGLAAGLGFGGAGRSMIQRRVDQILTRDWTSDLRSMTSLPKRYQLALGVTTLLAAIIWIPLNSEATGRTILSPWPSITAAALHEAGLEVRDYELDRHRLHEHSSVRMM